METTDQQNRNCKYFLPKKKRFCRIPPQNDAEYCVEHQPFDDSLQDEETPNKKLRVPCPFDNKHTCYAYDLRKHLKKCNARPKPPLPYVQSNYNCPNDIDQNGKSPLKSLHTYSTVEVKEVITKVHQIHSRQISGKIRQQFAKYSLIEKELSNPIHGKKSHKHLSQASAILGLIEHYQLLQENCCYVEFGAGRGQLTYWLARSLNEQKNFLLIEKLSPKHKCDNRDGRALDGSISRIRVDIADLVLHKVPIVEKCKHLVGICKHLCGDGTDLALRCLINMIRHSDKVTGCIMTFCCHHKCRWLPYTGREFFEQNNLNEQDFNIMIGMSSWATCGTGFSRKRKNESENDTDETNRDDELGLTRKQKEEIGEQSKDIINWGRLTFLEQHAFETNLYYYTEKNISPENVCIVALKA